MGGQAAVGRSRRSIAEGERPARASPEVDADGHDGQGGDGDAVVHIALDVGPALGEGAVHDEVVHHLVGDGGQGGLAIAGRPGVPHRLEGRAPSQPAVELGVGVHVEVGGDHAPPDGAHHVGVLRGDDEDAGHDLMALAAGALELGHRLADVLGAQPVEDHPVGLLAGQVEHAGAQGGHVDVGLLLGDPGQAEAVDREPLVGRP